MSTDNGSTENGKKPLNKKFLFILGAIFAVIMVVIIAVSVTTCGGSSSSNYGIGDTVRTGSAEVRVTRVSNTSVLGSLSFGESTNDNFVVVTVSVKNTGSGDFTVKSSDMKLRKGSKSYSVHSGSVYLSNPFYLIETVGSGITKTFSVAFETPTSSDEEEYVFSLKGAKITLKGNGSYDDGGGYY
ncbi:MAG: DUF4352 domain-containing protein [Clostridia bacterium]|nr:DUF4352 domain-containing protein [Clostridia bacterium]